VKSIMIANTNDKLFLAFEVSITYSPFFV